MKPASVIGLTGLATFLIAAGANVINGTADSDFITGTPGSDVINGKEGNDSLNGGGGDDVLNGGPGDDFIFNPSGVSTFNGGDGDDFLRSIGGDGVFRGGDGSDQMDQFGSVEFAFPPATCGEVVPSDATPEFLGGDGDDTIGWASGELCLEFNPAFCLLCASSGEAVANGGAGHDVIRVGLGSFEGFSTDYVIEPATVRGYDRQIRSIASGVTINFKNIEEVEFVDQVISL